VNDKDIRSIDTTLLRAMAALCPDGKGITRIEFSAPGLGTVTLTKESRDKAVAELKRREKKP
jgi:hypothetical protein